ncbi:hypothetical protein HIM_07752 [Hirsutella minnesotensis 3608]|uniref:DUF6570 domain-containing protein n=1 Tax=Hirsutella minnesotensis 3608 TaxID=1043627 RepID=A0A0F7ZTB2_9HYPO|nr:hypothetical protein HIM_07752 [Hirsutella minnesotensis 3608]
MAAITQEQAEGRSWARAARLRMQEQADEREETPSTLPLVIPEGMVRDPQGSPSEDRPRRRPPPPARPIPHTPSPRKRARDPQSEGLPTPPPTRPDRPRKRTRPSHDNARLQRESLKTILEHHESRFRDKEKESLTRSWCKEASFGYITKFIVDNKTPSGLSYRKHVKGHIVVFPNKVEDLVATVLPHPLLETIENIHVSWSGSSKPGAADVGHLLQVRKSRVRDALSWLQKNNPLYEHIAIDHGEIDFVDQLTLR